MKTWASQTVVVVGSAGMLGKELVPLLRDRVGREGGRMAAWDRNELDITDRPRAESKIREARPSVVFNCAAYTDVDGCESNRERAMRVNAEGPGLLARACAMVGAKLVHFSTDFIFDGSSDRPYLPNDLPNPLSAYGKSKALGEQAVHSSGGSGLIVRTAWLYGPHGRNFVDAIVSKARRGESLRVVDDQVGRPTYTLDLTDGVIRLLDAEAEGTFHFANDGQCSWHEFAVEIVRLSGIPGLVARLSSSELGRPAPRPAYSVLDLASYQRQTNHAPRHWKNALSDYLKRRGMEEKAA